MDSTRLSDLRSWTCQRTDFPDDSEMAWTRRSDLRSWTCQRTGFPDDSETNSMRLSDLRSWTCQRTGFPDGSAPICRGIWRRIYPGSDAGKPQESDRRIFPPGFSRSPKSSAHFVQLSDRRRAELRSETCPGKCDREARGPGIRVIASQIGCVPVITAVMTGAFPASSVSASE